MKIAFIDYIKWNYKIDSVYEKPLGGSQSAICYLAEKLALQGHEIFLFNNVIEIINSKNVICIPLNQIQKSLIDILDVVIISNATGNANFWRSLLPENTPLILWSGHDYDQPHVKYLANFEEKNSYDGFAFVSNWQQNRFIHQFNIPGNKTQVLCNSISPNFENLFPENISILNAKSNILTLAYTSTPFRGLEILLDIFPKIHQAIPNSKLKVFSSMKVYNYQEQEDQNKYGWLYQKCQETKGIEYVGSIPQPELAQQLKTIHLFAYPNTFPETSCIALMEAMASGCYVLTSNLGALPETANGFACLLPMEGYWEDYKQKFAQEAIAILKKFDNSERINLENHLRKQVNFVNSNYTWSIRFQEWLEWLTTLKAHKFLDKQNYEDAINYYEQEIEKYPDFLANYWYLGLIFLLKGDEFETQNIWMSVMLNDDLEIMEVRQKTLLKMLKSELERYKFINDLEIVKLLTNYVQDLSSNNE